MTAATVGIVLVSHSAELAAGTAYLAAQVSGGTVTIIAAGGTDDGDLGTSAAKVVRGLSEAESGAGVVVLPDLGSAVLTVRAVLEDHGDAESVLLADAPFVEGAVAATVTAAPAATSRRSPPRQRRHVMSASCEQVITLAGDLHARPAGALAVAAGRFAAAVSVTADGHTADAKSVLGLMGLGPPAAARTASAARRTPRRPSPPSSPSSPRPPRSAAYCAIRLTAARGSR